MTDEEVSKSFRIWPENTNLIGKRGSSGLGQLLLVLLHLRGVDLDLGGLQSGGSNELQRRVTGDTISHRYLPWLRHDNLPDQLPCEPQERLLEVVVGLGRDFKVLQVLLSVEGDTGSLDLSLLDIDLVTAQHDRDVLTDSFQISVPVGDVLVGDSRCNVEHDDTTLTWQKWRR
jgi:hypothetical protein